MIRGKKDLITITRDEVTKQPKVQVDGLWTGKDRNRIGRMLLRAMRTAAYQERQSRKQADQKEQIQKVAIEGAEHFDLIEKKRLEGLKKYWAAKKEKKLKEEEKENVRGQHKEK